jgi:tRNA U34 2-thiouridine synthase MnmA/TrmU
MTKAIGCISGGLDSQLAVCLLQRQGIAILALHVQHLWHPKLLAEDDRNAGVRAIEARGVPVRLIDAAEADLEMIQHPEHGFGKRMNPCIDCRIWTLREAKRLMEEEGADFVFTGEVVGQRPMSQHLGALALVEREAGLKDLLVRPLSAKCLSPTRPEREGKVNRDALMDFAGRSRKPQMALAAEFGLTDYPTPAGGCLLTDPGFAYRLRELMDHGKPTIAGVELLKVGRHFRLADGSRVVVGRRHEDNLRLEKLLQPGDVRLEADRMPGPTGLLRGKIPFHSPLSLDGPSRASGSNERGAGVRVNAVHQRTPPHPTLSHDGERGYETASEESITLAAGLVLRYGKAKPGEVHPVRVAPVGQAPRILDARPADDELAQRLIISPENPR